jgi:hypothetical protein
MMPIVTISAADIARRFAEADRQVRLLRQATREMQAVRRQLLAARRRGPDRSDRDRAGHR